MYLIDFFTFLLVIASLLLACLLLCSQFSTLACFQRLCLPTMPLLALLCYLLSRTNLLKDSRLSCSDLLEGACSSCPALLGDTHLSFWNFFGFGVQPRLLRSIDLFLNVLYQHHIIARILFACLSCPVLACFLGSTAQGF